MADDSKPPDHDEPPFQAAPPEDRPIRFFGKKTFKAGTPPPLSLQPLQPGVVIPKGTWTERRAAIRRMDPLERRALLEAQAAARRQRQARIGERRKQAMDLWIAGATYRQIGVALSIPHQRARDDVQKMLAEQHADEFADTREKRRWQWLISKRVVRGLAVKAFAGDWNAAREMKGYLDHMAKLEGLFAPVKVASTNPDGDQWAPFAIALQGLTDDELRLANKLAEMRALPPMPGETVEGEVMSG